MTRRFLVGLACALTCGAAYFFLRCRHVNAKRHPMGGFICPDCHFTSKDIPTLEQPYVGHLSTGWRGNGVERTAR